MNAHQKPAQLPSIITAILMATAAAAAIFSQSLYRDNLLVVAAWLGNDVVTLVVAVPVLLVAMRFAKRGSDRGRLVWMGMLAYAFYNSAFYLFGAAFNSLFLVYVVVFTLSGFALIFGLAGLDAGGIGWRFRASTPAWWIGGYMMAVAVCLGTFHVALAVGYLVTGEVPEIVTRVGNPTNVISALDLSMVVPLNILGAVWLWKRRAWGYVLAAIANVKGAVYMLALCAGTISAFLAGTSNELDLLWLWGAIGIGCLAACILLFSNLDKNTA